MDSISMASGLYWFCLKSSTMRAPRSSFFLVRGVEVGAELGEGLQFAELREVELGGAGHRLDRLGLRGGADARHRETDRDGRADALVEEVGFQDRSGRR